MSIFLKCNCFGGIILTPSLCLVHILWRTYVAYDEHDISKSFALRCYRTKSMYITSIEFYKFYSMLIVKRRNYLLVMLWTMTIEKKSVFSQRIGFRSLLLFYALETESSTSLRCQTKSYNQFKCALSRRNLVLVQPKIRFQLPDG